MGTLSNNNSYAVNVGDGLIKVLRPTRHKIGHFGDVLPSRSLGSVLKNLKNNKANIHP